MWNFDGVACAAALELGNPIYFFHSNHLIYAFFGYLFWKPISGILPRALPALQLFTSILSASALVGLFCTLRDVLPMSRRMPLMLTLCVSASAVVWVWSIEAQVYALGFLALSWATYELFRTPHPGRWTRVGWLHAGAILGHIVHVIWIIPALYWLKRQGGPIRGHARQYLVPVIIGTAVPYALVIAGFLTVGHADHHWLAKWLMGSAALNPTSVFQWHWGGALGPILWLKTSFRLFWGGFLVLPYANPDVVCVIDVFIHRNCHRLTGFFMETAKRSPLDLFASLVGGIRDLFFDLGTNYGMLSYDRFNSVGRLDGFRLTRNLLAMAYVRGFSTNSLINQFMVSNSTHARSKKERRLSASDGLATADPRRIGILNGRSNPFPISVVFCGAQCLESPHTFAQPRFFGAGD